MITDDPETPGNGNWEINSNMLLEKQSADKIFEAPHIDFNYGLGERIQLKFETSLLVQFSSQGEETGLDQSLFGIKWRFLDENKHGFNMSMYPQFALDGPQSSVNKGLIDQGSQLFIPFQVSRRLGDFKLDTELGYNFIQHSSGEFNYGVVLGYEASENVELLAEIHGISQQYFEEGDLIFNVGGRVKMTDNVSLIFAAGRSFLGGSDSGLH